MDKRYGRMRTGQGSQTTSNLSEKDMLQDMLLTEKYLSETLNHAILESDSDQTRQIFSTLQDNAQGHAHMIYDAMAEQGWYTGETAGQSNIQNKRYRTTGNQGEMTNSIGGTQSQGWVTTRGSRSYLGSQAGNNVRGTSAGQQQTGRTF